MGRALPEQGGWGGGAGSLSECTVGAENSKIVGQWPNQPMELSCSQTETNLNHHLEHFNGSLTCEVQKAHKKEGRILTTTGIAVIS